MADTGEGCRELPVTIAGGQWVENEWVTAFVGAPSSPRRETADCHAVRIGELTVRHIGSDIQ